MTHGKRIHDLLAASDAVRAIAGGRIYPLVLPQKVTADGTRTPADVFPAIVYTAISDVVSPTIGVTEPRNARIQIDCYSRRYDGAHGLADAVTGAVHNVKGAGFAARLISRRDGFEDETELFRVSMDFSQWMVEADNE